MRVELQPVYVLHSRPFKDSSLIVDTLSHEYGRLSLLAKGARSAKSRQRQLCQPFIPLLVSWQGKSHLKTLTSIESRHAVAPLRGDHLYSGLYLNELLVRLLPEQDACPEVYLRYSQALIQLSSLASLEPVLRDFELGLLADLGYRVDFTFDAMRGCPLDAASEYEWRDQQGWGAVTGALPGAFSGACLLAIGQGDYREAETLKQAKRLTRMLLKPLLGQRPLQSRQLFKKY